MVYHKSNTSRNQLKIVDVTNRKIIHEDIPFGNHALKIGHSYRYFFTYADSLSVIPLYDNSVYRIAQKNGAYFLKTAYEFDFGKYWIPQEILADSYENRSMFFEHAPKYVHTLDVFETEEILYVHYKFDKKDYTFIYGKGSNEEMNLQEFVNRNTGWVGKPEAVQGGWIVNLVTYDELKKHNINRENLIKNPDKDFGLSSHPVLVFAEFDI